MKPQSVQTPPRSYFLSSIHPTATLVARSVTPQEIAIVDWESQQTVHRFRADQGTVRAVALHPDGQRVALVGEGNVVKVWDALAKTSLGSTEVADAQNVRFSPDGRFLAVGRKGAVSVFETDGLKELWHAEHAKLVHPALLAVSPDSGWLAWSAMGAPDIRVLAIETGEVVCAITTTDEVLALAFHPDGKRLASCVNTERSPLMRQVVVWSVKANLPDREFSIPFSAVAVAVSPNGGTVATGEKMGAQLWDYSNGSPLRRLATTQSSKVKGLGTIEQPQDSLVTALRFDATGEKLVSDGDALQVWNVQTGERIWSYQA